jgi:hypothetical protein
MLTKSLATPEIMVRDSLVILDPLHIIVDETNSLSASGHMGTKLQIVVVNQLEQGYTPKTMAMAFVNTSTTNPKLKSLKEGMVEVFLKKMKLQEQKHNKRYTLNDVSSAPSLPIGKLARRLPSF